MYPDSPDSEENERDKARKISYEKCMKTSHKPSLDLPHCQSSAILRFAFCIFNFVRFGRETSN